MTPLTDRIFQLKRRRYSVFDIANVVGLTPEQVVARLKDPTLADPSSGVGLLPEAPGASAVPIPPPADPFPITLPWDEDLLALTTGSAGPDGENSYMNNTAADVTAAPVVIPTFSLSKGIYTYDAMGIFDFGATYAEFGATGVALLAELRKQGDNSRVGWANNDDPFWGTFWYATPDLAHGDFNGDTHPAGGAKRGPDNTGPSGGTFYLSDDVTVTLRAVNQGGYEQDPYTGDQSGRDIEILALGVSIRPI